MNSRFDKSLRWSVLLFFFFFGSTFYVDKVVVVNKKLYVDSAVGLGSDRAAGSVRQRKAGKLYYGR
jgi:hypothetical protein